MSDIWVEVETSGERIAGTLGFGDTPDTIKMTTYQHPEAPAVRVIAISNVIRISRIDQPIREVGQP